MRLGLLLILAAGLMIYFGAAHRVLDRLYLTDRQALLVLGAIVIGSYVDFNITRDVGINLGGGLIPIILAAYILANIDSRAERRRAVLSIAVTTLVLYGSIKLFAFEEGGTLISPLYFFGLVAGVIAYVVGRSRRAAFVSAVLGLVAVDLLTVLEVSVRELPTTIIIGGAGVFDAVVVAGVLAVLLTEFVGEGRERLEQSDTRGGNRVPVRPLELRKRGGVQGGEDPVEDFVDGGGDNVDEERGEEN